MKLIGTRLIGWTMCERHPISEYGRRNGTTLCLKTVMWTAKSGIARYITILALLYDVILCHIHVICQVYCLFWASRIGSTESIPLAFVRYYTTETTGRVDNTELTKICWELERRPAAGMFPGIHPRFEVVDIASLIKLEHIVPMWHDTTKEMFYVNRYASFAYEMSLFV